MHGIRASHCLWTVWRFEVNEHGWTDGAFICANFWHEAEAIAERDRLEKTNTNGTSSFEVMEDMATVVYPADEEPPWVDDPDRFRRRGYEPSNW